MIKFIWIKGHRIEVVITLSILAVLAAFFNK